jgi:hypothetical protein
LFWWDVEDVSVHGDHEPPTRSEHSPEFGEAGGAFPEHDVVDRDGRIHASFSASGAFCGAVTKDNTAGGDVFRAAGRGHFAHGGRGVHADDMPTGLHGVGGQGDADAGSVPGY